VSRNGASADFFSASPLPCPTSSFYRLSMSLRIKFTLLITFLLAIIIAGISVSLFFTYKQLYRAQLEQNRQKIFKDFNYTCTEAVTVRDEILIVNTIRSLIETHRPSIVYAGYVSPTGIILSSIRDNLRQDSFNYRIFKLSRPADDNFMSERSEEIFEMGLPIMVKGEYGGTVKVGFSQDYLNKQIEDTVVLLAKKIGIVSAAALLVGILFAFILSAHLNKPIKILSQAAVKLGEGDLTVQVAVDRNDELGKLSNTFNEMARRVKEIDELKDSFVSSVSHELRSPLAAIDGYCDFLLDGLDKNMTPDKQKKALEIIRDSTVRLTNFINNILDLAKIKAGRLEIKPIPTDMKDIAEEIMQLFVPLAARESKKLVVDIAPDLPRIYVDPERVKQVITNLLGNSLKFTPSEAVITISAVQVNDRIIEISLSDTGVGIPQADLPKVFEKFYQVKEGANKKPKGTGLGLAIVAEIVKLHGGNITVESTVGKGTTFRFTMPVWRQV